MDPIDRQEVLAETGKWLNDLLEDDSATDIRVGIRMVRVYMKQMPSVQPDNIWNELSKVYNMDTVPDEAKSIIGDVMLGLGEQPDHAWHECFEDDPASFPDNDRNVLVSLSNFSLSIIGQWRVDDNGSGCWYLGDTDETFLSEGLLVDGWWELPRKPRRNYVGPKG